MNSESPRPLRLWQFRIRDILAITTICALLLGWWGERMRWRSELDARRHLQDALEQERSRIADLDKRWDLLFGETITPGPKVIELDTRPIVHGIVRAISAANANIQLAEINIGSKDGLVEGTELQVISATSLTPIGKIKLTRVEADDAVGQVIALQPGCAIQRRDHVVGREPFWHGFDP